MKKESRISSVLVWIFVVGSLFARIYTVKNGTNYVDAPIIFSMEEIGFDYSEIISAKIDSYNLNSKESVEYYNLHLKGGKNEYVTHFEFTVIDCENSKIANEVFEVAVIYAKEKEPKPYCRGTCFYLPTSFEYAIEGMYKLENDLWDIDSGYSQLDFNMVIEEKARTYYIVMIKDNQVMVIETTFGIEFSNDDIRAIVSILDRTDSIFEKGENDEKDNN